MPALAMPRAARGETRAMLILRLIGALLVLAGVIHLVVTTIQRGRMSEPGPTPDSHARSLEPRRSGLGALAGGAAWPGLAMIALGDVLLLLPLALP
jgi:hypothetical protein